MLDIKFQIPCLHIRCCDNYWVVMLPEVLWVEKANKWQLISVPVKINGFPSWVKKIQCIKLDFKWLICLHLDEGSSLVSIAGRSDTFGPNLGGLDCSTMVTLLFIPLWWLWEEFFWHSLLMSSFLSTQFLSFFTLKGLDIRQSVSHRVNTHMSPFVCFFPTPLSP